MSIDTGGPAFPQPTIVGINGEVHDFGSPSLGMTLLDWFAGQAMQGLIASGCIVPCRSTTPEGIEAERKAYAKEVATSSYRYADAMIAARKGVTP